MSSNYFKIVLLVLISLNLFAKEIKPKENKLDLLILQALDYELHHNFKKSAEIYEELYQKTQKIEFLNKAVSNFYRLKKYKKIEKLSSNYKNIKNNKMQEKIAKNLVYALIKQKKFEKALQVAKDILKHFNTPQNYALVGEIYYNLKQYKFAANYFESSYAAKQDSSTLIPLVETLYSYLNQKKKAISYLETFYRQQGCDRMVCAKLLIYYQQNNNLDGVISILKVMYEKFNSSYTKKLKKIISSMLINALEKKDIDEAIRFLEKNDIDNLKLIQLYSQKGKYKKAYHLVKKEYLKTKNKELLAQIAILEFEMAKDKVAVLPHVIANFKEALKVTDKSTYLNYYGYLLIDYNIDIKKGLDLAKKALQKAPNNFAYMDSVAWGYYKIGRCDLAFYYMKKVVDNIGLDNIEIKNHWQTIKKCIKQ